MSEYKYLVMQSNAKNNVGFLTASLGGSHRCANVDTNVTNFTPHDFGGGHENDDYWNSPEELLVGFSVWYSRWEERKAHNMGNRIYAANATYRFFKVNTGTYGDCEDEMFQANQDLPNYEVSEETFIADMLSSREIKILSELFVGDPVRPAQLPTRVSIVYSKEFNTWCWSSDYRNKEDYNSSNEGYVDIPLGYHYDDAITYISDIYDCEYRFGGNDAYNKRKELEDGYPTLLR